MNGNVSQLLRRWHEGDESALAALAPMVYAELRRLGRRSLHRLLFAGRHAPQARRS